MAVRPPSSIEGSSAAARLGRKLFRGAAWTGVAVVAGRFATFTQYALLTRFLDKEGFGALGLARSMVLLTGVLALQGMPTALVRFVAAFSAREEHDRVRSAVARGTAAVVAGTCLGTSAIAWAMWSGWGLRSESHRRLAPLWVGVALWVVFHPLSELFVGVLRGRGRFGTSAALRHLVAPAAVSALVLVGGALSLGGAGERISWALMAFVSAACLKAGVAAALLGPWWRALPRGAPIRWRALLGTGWSLGAQTWLFTVSNQGLVWWTSQASGDADVARLVASTQLASFVSFPLLIFANVVDPLVARLHARGERDRMERVVRASATVTALGGGLVALVLMLAAPTVLRWAYGAEYASDAPVLRLLVAGELLRAMLGFSGSVLAMTAAHLVRLRNGVVATVASWLLAIWAVPAWGAEGSAWVRVLFLATMLLANWMVARRRVGIWAHPWWRLGEVVVLLDWIRRQRRGQKEHR